MNLKNNLLMVLFSFLLLFIGSWLGASILNILRNYSTLNIIRNYSTISILFYLFFYLIVGIIFSYIFTKRVDQIETVFKLGIIFSSIISFVFLNIFINYNIQSVLFSEINIEITESGMSFFILLPVVFLFSLIAFNLPFLYYFFKYPKRKEKLLFLYLIPIFIFIIGFFILKLTFALLMMRLESVEAMAQLDSSMISTNRTS